MTRFAIVACLVLTGCAQETPEEAWLRRQHNRCRAMGSSGTYDSTTAIFECWRHAIARNPKLMFKESYRRS